MSIPRQIEHADGQLKHGFRIEKIMAKKVIKKALEQSGKDDIISFSGSLQRIMAFERSDFFRAKAEQGQCIGIEFAEC